MFLEICSLTHGELLGAFNDYVSLSSEARTIVMEDFERGRSYLQLGLGVKFDFWGKLPWKLCGLSHYDADVARSVGEEVSAHVDTQSNQINFRGVETLAIR